jgi:hypothetical protein
MNLIPLDTFTVPIQGEGRGGCHVFRRGSLNARTEFKVGPGPSPSEQGNSKEVALGAVRTHQIAPLIVVLSNGAIIPLNIPPFVSVSGFPHFRKPSAVLQASSGEPDQHD